MSQIQKFKALQNTIKLTTIALVLSQQILNYYTKI